MKKILSLILLSTILTGCYHATIVTDKAPSNIVIDQPWSLGFVYGLIPPPDVDASQKCTDGIAKVETKHSFLNQLVSGLTFGLVTPIHITVTCAAPGGMAMNETANTEIIEVPVDASTEEIQEIYKFASDLAVMKETSVYVRH